MEALKQAIAGLLEPMHPLATVLVSALRRPRLERPTGRSGGRSTGSTRSSTRSSAAAPRSRTWPSATTSCRC